MIRELLSTDQAVWHVGTDSEQGQILCMRPGLLQHQHQKPHFASNLGSNRPALGPERSGQCQCSSCVPELRSQVAVRDLFKVEQTRASIRFCHSTARTVQRWRSLACFRVAAIAMRCFPVAGSRARLFFSCEHLRHKTPSWNSIVACHVVEIGNRH